MMAALLGAVVAACLTAVAVVVASRQRGPTPDSPPSRPGSSTNGPGASEGSEPDELALLAGTLGLHEVEAGRFEGPIGRATVIIRQLRPPLVTGDRTSVKTEISATFTTAPPVPFLVHERGPAVVGSAVTTGDAVFDTRFVVRSVAGEAAAPLFGPAVRAAILRYAQVAPTLDLTDRRIDAVVEGPADDTARIRQLVELQLRVVEAITGPA